MRLPEGRVGEARGGERSLAESLRVKLTSWSSWRRVRGRMQCLVLSYVIKPRCAFLKEQKEAKDSLIETLRLLLQEWPEQAGRGRLSPSGWRAT